jgi:nucleoside-diphosphate-sugar epimerase
MPDLIGGTNDWTIALQGLDTVVHCAALAHQIGPHAQHDPEVYETVNALGSEQLALAAVKAGVRRMVLLSTAKVLGESTPMGQPFTHLSAAQPHDAYARSKWSAEQRLQRVARQTGLDVVVVRPPLVYGPGVGANFAAMARWVCRGRPLPLGAVLNARSLVGLGNLCSLLEQTVLHPMASGQTLLVSDGHDVSTPQLAQLMAAHCPRSPGHAWLLPVPVPLLLAAGALVGKRAAVQRLTESLQLDISHTQTLLNWTPPYKVEHQMAQALKELV